MKDNIAEKLSELLKQPIAKECEVVYFMVEARKIIEHKRKELEKNIRYNYYPTLTFYSNWCLHIELSKDNAKNYLGRIDSYMNRTTGDIDEAFFEFLQFEELKKEVGYFLKEYGVESVAFFKDWKNFSKILVEVLADCPLLTIEPQPGQIKSFNFEKSSESGGRKVFCSVEFEKNSDGSNYSASIGIF